MKAAYTQFAGMAAAPHQGLRIDQEPKAAAAEAAAADKGTQDSYGLYYTYAYLRCKGSKRYKWYASKIRTGSLLGSGFP